MERAPRQFPGVPVETKLYAPAVRREWVPRQRLVQDLAATRAKLVLVEAPAGFGKTTLIAQWRADAMETRPFTWISLDSWDNDPGRFWWHVVCGLQRACPGLEHQALLRFLRAQVPDISGLLPSLANALAELCEPVVLVLDDYHVIKERRCHEQVGFLLAHLLPPAQIVLISRTEPPLPLARLRAAGEITEIRTRELLFTRAEAAALIATVAAVRLTGRDLAALSDRTEGWPAGVYLVALSLRDRSPPGTFVRQLSGTNRHIVDYLLEEVLDSQPEDVRRFLTHTAILGRFTAPLCEAVTGAAGTAGTIDVLERENLFVVALDDNRRWFRYHHLFGEVLRRKLELDEPELVPVLHRRASAWHRAHGAVEDAVDHALAGGDVAGAVDLIAGHWLAYVSAGRAATVQGWLAALGDEEIRANPLAAHCAAWVAALSGEPEGMRHLVPVIETGERAGRLPDGMQSLAFSAALLRGAFGFDGLADMRESAARAVALERDRLSPWYMFALAVFGMSLYWSGASGASEPLRRAATSETASPLVRLVALVAETFIAVEAGRLAQAEALADAARQLAEDEGLSKTAQSSLAHAAVGLVCAEQGRLDEARAKLEQALRLRQRWFRLSPWPTVEFQLRLASVLLDLGEPAGAGSLLREVRTVLGELPDGAEALFDRLRVLEQRLSRVLSGATLAGSLTERETVVLRWLEGSLTRAEIAQELRVSQNTVKTYVQAIYRKLGVTTRRDAVARARELGLL